jgi:AraC-like DNA-binding protein
MTIHMITGASLSGMPEVVRRELGPLAERRAFRSAGLTPTVLTTENAFIPETALVGFIDSVARQAGTEHIGLAISRCLSITRYGTWGRYVLEGETLGDSLARFNAGISMHASYSTFNVEEDAGLAWIKYRFAVSGQGGYVNLAFCAAGILIDYVRQYVNTDWVPDVIELDVPRPTTLATIEDAFPCRIRFDAPRLGVGFNPALLRSPRRCPLPEKLTTLTDVSRARQNSPPTDVEGVVRELVRVQMRAGTVNLDSAARALCYGTRRLQRALERGGFSFREIVRSVRLETAKELIAETKLPFSTIGAQLGYSDKCHFSRAFRRDAGCTPGEYRIRYGNMFL